MGLRCSLLGHAYGEPAVERDRDDRGDEVVVTVREVRTCSRCGAETVVSENTEVRPVEPMPEDEGSSPDAAATTDAPAGTAESVDDGFDAPASAAEDDGVILDDEETGGDVEEERDPGEWPEADDTRVDDATAEGGPEAADPAADAAADDANEEPVAEQSTLDAGTADTDTDAGEDEEAGEDGIIDAEAAESGGTGDATAGDWPDPGPGATDEGFDAEPDDGNGDVEMGGLTPTGVSDAGDADPDEETVGGGGVGTGIETSPESGTAGDDVDVNARFVCPNCDYDEPVIDSSLREGDICPDCRRGYLAERSATRN